MPLKTLALTIAISLVMPLAKSAPPLDGEYLCDECHGYMTLKKNGTNTYQLKLVVGGGSCGGEEFAKGTFTLAPENKLLIPWKQKKKKCTTQIEFEGSKAYVSDSCISAEDEADSTCAVLGEYTKRSSGH